MTPRSPSKKKKMASWMHSAVVEPYISKKHFIVELVVSLGFNQQVLSRLEPLDQELANKKS